MSYLRLIHCLLEDELICAAYIQSFDAKSKGEMGTNNPDVIGPNVYKMIADKWNDMSFNPATDVFHVHDDYDEPFSLAYHLVSHLQPLTSDKAQEKLSDMRVKLGCG
jgi:hypothetical protein